MVTEQMVWAVLDKTYPNWREELDPMNFKTFAAYKEALAKAYSDGLIKLGIRATWVN